MNKKRIKLLCPPRDSGEYRSGNDHIHGICSRTDNSAHNCECLTADYEPTTTDNIAETADDQQQHSSNQ